MNFTIISNKIFSFCRSYTFGVRLVHKLLSLELDWASLPFLLDNTTYSDVVAPS